MPRAMRQAMTLEDFEDEALYTRAAIKADENAADLLGKTDNWLGWISDVEALDRSVREQIADVDASRTVANTNLDIVCTKFADDLYLACGKDRSSTRWTQFFKEPVSSFIKVALSDQTRKVKGWLASATDTVLETHREALTKWSDRADAALNSTESLTGVRGNLWQRRETLATDLTSDRDNLSAELARRAQERGLPRDWPAQFFRVERRDTSTTESAKKPAAQPAPAEPQ